MGINVGVHFTITYPYCDSLLYEAEFIFRVILAICINNNKDKNGYRNESALSERKDNKTATEPAHTACKGKL